MKLEFSKLILSIIVYFLSNGLKCQVQTLALLKNNSSDFVVSIPGKPTADEERAASILRYYFKIATGYNLPISNSTAFPKLIVISKDNSLSRQSFSLTVKSNDLIEIKGGIDGGPINGVWFFLRSFVGIDYLAANALNFKIKSNIDLPGKIRVVKAPSFTSRMIFSTAGVDGDYSECHALSSPFFDHYNFAHSSNEWLPPRDFFGRHPEYYIELNSKRDTLQPNLLNPDVFEIVLRNIKKRISQDSLKKYKYYSFSLMDNPFISQDSITSKKLSSGKFNYTDILLSFVNRLADSLPNSNFTTLAYEQTKAAPKVEAPRKNVTIILTNADNDRSKSLTTDSKDYVLNLDMKVQMKKWVSLDSSIILWDYLGSMSNNLMPWPVLYTIQPNLKLFQKYGIENLFIQTAGDISSINTELRTYLCANLMWDVDLNVDSLLRSFCQSFYGSAWKNVYSYIHEINMRAIDSKEQLFTYDNASKLRNGLFAYSKIVSWRKLLANAALNSQDVNCRNRILKEKLGLDYVFLELSTKYKDWNPVDGRVSLDKKLRIFRQDCTLLGVKNLNATENSLESFITELAGHLEKR